MSNFKIREGRVRGDGGCMVCGIHDADHRGTLPDVAVTIVEIGGKGMRSSLRFCDRCIVELCDVLRMIK